MSKWESIIIRGMGGLAAVFAVATLMTSTIMHREVIRIPEPEEIKATRQEVVGKAPLYRGNPSAPFTLVEFGDYQCPPCRQLSNRIPQLLSRYPRALNFVFRNLPLTAIHPYALSAAILVERAREHGKFWKIHDRLYREEVNSRLLAVILADEHLNPAVPLQALNSSGNQKINGDIRLARHLGLYGTPSFLLCCPDGRVLHLFSLEQAAVLID